MNNYNRAFDPNEPVYFAECNKYDEDLLFSALGRISEKMDDAPLDLKGKKVVIKPNLVAKKSPDDPAIVNPIFISAVIRWLKENGADDITIAESPGGVYNTARLRGIYTVSGVDKIAEMHGIKLNYDLGYREISNPDGRMCRLFEIIDPILSADVIVDLCKLKTHALTGMSCAVKNLFGTIPGVVKFEMHSRYPDYDDFANVLVDLCEMLAKRSEIISITDAVIGMEGNGPTAGTAREIGAVIVSRNPFASDSFASYLINCDGEIPMVNYAAERGYTYKTFAECNVIGVDSASPESLFVKDYKQPDSRKHNPIDVIKNLWGGRIYKIFEPYPIIDYGACLGCGECAASCPKDTIKMMPKEEVKGGKKSKAKKVPVIIRDNCIKCFCCQELCPHKVVKIRKNPITRILS